MLCVSLGAIADDEPILVPHLVITGVAEEPVKVELEQYNRIYFGENSLTLRSTADTNAADIELLYSLYNRMEIKDEPKQSVGVEDVVADSGATLAYLAAQKELTLTASTADKFTVGVFNGGGLLVLAGKIAAGETISVANLAPGVYVAVATDDSAKTNLKFIVK